MHYLLATPGSCLLKRGVGRGERPIGEVEAKAGWEDGMAEEGGRGDRKILGGRRSGRKWGGRVMGGGDGGSDTVFNLVENGKMRVESLLSESAGIDCWRSFNGTAVRWRLGPLAAPTVHKFPIPIPVTSRGEVCGSDLFQDLVLIAVQYDNPVKNPNSIRLPFTVAQLQLVAHPIGVGDCEWEGGLWNYAIAQLWKLCF